MGTVPNPALSTERLAEPAEIRKAHAAGYVEGVRDRLSKKSTVEKAIEALKDFECSTFEEARRLLGLWSGRREMTLPQVKEVLDHFREMETIDALLGITLEQAAAVHAADRPCPDWCEVNHLDPEVFARETDPVIQARGHSRYVLTDDDADMSVRIYQLEHLTDDEESLRRRGHDAQHEPTEVVIGADSLSPDDADRLAAAIVEAARIARG
jgi:hypothetical protein